MEHKRIKNLLFKKLFASLLTLASIFIMLADGLQSSYANETNKSSITNSLFNNDGEDEFLSPDVAFKLNLTATDANSIQAKFTVAPGYYLYRERIKFLIQPATQGVISKVILPAGEIKNDPNFGKQEVYHHDFNADIKVASIKNNAMTIAATYQGCSEKGLCYAPIKKMLTVDFPAAGSAINNTSTQTADDNDTDITKVLKSGNLWLVIAGFFVAGLLLSLTPCVLPMIPILSSIIVGSRSKAQIENTMPFKLHAFGLSVAYVLGMALSYTLAGIAAGLSGSLLSQSLQNPWVLGVTALLFVGFALSMFGFYELRLPANFESKMMSSSNKFKGGQFLGVFTMGILSALIVSPCVAAPLAGALIYIGQTHNVLLGGAGLFALAIGMGVPLLLIGASAGSLLPKTGNWMNAVRNFFGSLMLGMAIWLISPVIPTSIQLALWAALLIMNAVYLNALDNLSNHANNFAKFWKGIAVILLIVGVALLIGALSGAKSIWQPFSGFNHSIVNTSAGTQQKNASTLAFNRISSIAELDKRLADTKGQPVMLDFYADWCVACKELEEYTFSDPKVQQSLKNTVLLQVDVTANTEEDKALLKRFALYGPPGIVFFNGNGKEISTIKTVGFQNADRFMKTLAKRDSCLLPMNKDLIIKC